MCFTKLSDVTDTIQWSKYDKRKKNVSPCPISYEEISGINSLNANLVQTRIVYNCLVFILRDRKINPARSLNIYDRSSALAG